MSVELLIILMTAAACTIIALLMLAAIKAVEAIVKAIKWKARNKKRKQF